MLTTGTGSGKSLSYFIPIVDDVLRRKRAGKPRKGITAIVVYPMNALCNSQRDELERFLKLGYDEGKEPVTFARYTGQESSDERERITKNPPDILLTTPLNALQIVLGNLFGRLFFVLALLLSTLPLFSLTQLYGGVPGPSIFFSYAIAACSAFVVAAIAVTLSVTRTAGRRAVFVFYTSVVLYLFATYAVDTWLRVPTAAGSASFNS